MVRCSIHVSIFNHSLNRNVYNFMCNVFIDKKMHVLLICTVELQLSKQLLYHFTIINDADYISPSFVTFPSFAMPKD